MKIKRYDDKTRNFIDKYNYYTDASFNEASVNLDNLYNSEIVDNVNIGGITVPMQNGHMYADTPECTIFIVKRQWYEQEYNYFSGSNDLERNGKKKELLVRLALANIIQRKLDYLNNHEIVTKYNKFFKDLNNNQDRLYGSLITRYYTENFTLNDELNDFNDIYNQEYLVIVNKIKIKKTNKIISLYTNNNINSEKLFDLNYDVEIITSGIGDINNPDNVLDISINKNSKYYGKYNKSKLKWVKIDLSQLILDSDFYKLINNNINDKYIAGDNIYDILLNITRLKDKYNRSINKYAYIKYEENEDVVEILDQKKYYLAYKEKDNSIDVYKKNYKNIFNGVIELCNVESVSTSINNKSNIGSAEFIIYNPNNILTITDEDIDIALSEHPFLDIITDKNGKKIESIYEYNPFTGEKEYFLRFRGRYYTEYVYNIVVSNYIKTIYNTTINDLLQLKYVLEDDLNKLKNILININTGNINQNQYDNVLSSTYNNIGNYVVDVKTKINKSDFSDINVLKIKLNKRINEIENVINDLAQYYTSTNSSSNSIYNINNKERKYIKNLLRKLYRNKTIFDIYDKVHIFLTSPTRSIKFDINGNILSEEPTIYKDIINYIKEINNILASLYNYIKYDYDQYILKINQYLLNAEIQQTKNIIDLIVRDIKKDSIIESIIKSVKNKIDEFSNYYDKYIKDKNSKIFNLKNIQLNIDITNPFDVIQKLNEVYIGIVENQYQCFEGVIKSIRRDYRNGIYTINISCSDNLDYLDRSQYIYEPNLLTPASSVKYTFLDDPIWREKDNKLIRKVDKEILDDLVGRWKTGILTLTANYTTNKDIDSLEKDISNNNKLDTDLFTIDDLNRMIGMIPTVLNEPFGGADPANIISVLVTGVPFNINTYLLNTIFGGNIKLTPYNDGKYYFGDVIPFGPFEMIRRQILGQIKKFGNFEPFLAITNLFIDKNSIIESNYNTLINIANGIIYFIKDYINTHNDLYQELINNIKEKEKDKKTIWYDVNKDNLKDCLNFNYEKFHENVNEISLNKNFENFIGVELTFLIYAIIRYSVNYNQIVSKTYLIDKINDIFTKNFNIDDLKLIYNMNNYGNLEKESYKYKILTYNYNFIFYIQDKVRERLDKGRLYNKIFDYYNNKLDTDYKPGKYYPSKDIIDKEIQIRDMYQPNKLMATKQSIINKTKSNFLVIHDKYLLNDDLIDYCREIKSTPGDLRPAQFATVLTRCIKAAKKIDFEFYADSQGNIIFKPPTYNRTLPGHLFKIDNIDLIFKKEILDLFKNENVYDVIIKMPILNKYKNIVKEFKKHIFINIKESVFSITNTIILYNNIKNKYNKNFLISIIYDKFKDIEEIIKVSNYIDAEYLQLDGEKYTLDISYNNNDAINYKHYYELQEKFKNFNYEKILENINKYIIEIKNKSKKDIEKLNNDIADNIIKIIKNMYNILKNTSSLLSTIELEISKIKYDYSNYINDITDISHIHILDSSIIISESYNEEYPDFTRLNCYTEIPYINGALSGDRIEQLYASWAGSVDYDLMRVYGYKNEDVYCPFITQPKHLAIYSHILMARQRSRIFNAIITVRGDSKYQVGDCVYIPDEDMYYYITNVSHSFTYGGSYETTLTLEYGRRVGYFIPYPFDVIGKKYSNNFSLIFQNNEQISIQDIIEFNK